MTDDILKDDHKEEEILTDKNGFWQIKTSESGKKQLMLN